MPCEVPFCKTTNDSHSDGNTSPSPWRQGREDKGEGDGGRRRRVQVDVG
jgi:hypothetical protein